MIIPDEEVDVYLVDALVDVLGLDVHCRWQLACCCRCSCPVQDDLVDVDVDVATSPLHMLLHLGGSIRCLDAILDVDVHLDIIVVYPDVDAIHYVDLGDANLLLPPIHHLY